MMTPEQLKNSILQLAIEGKLVPQIASEGTGAELLEKIRTPQSQQVATAPLTGGKKSAKSKQKTSQLGEVANEVSRRGFPFAIPKTWAWCRLGEVIQIKSGENITSTQMQKGVIPVYGGNGITGYHNKALVHEETIVIGRVGFYCGSVHITEKEAWVTDNAFITTYPKYFIDRNFLVYLLRHIKLGRDNNATAQPVVSGKKIYPILIPLPPLAEQKRIVAKLEELLPLVDEYAEAYNKLQTLNSKFPDDLKKSLLQYAMEGKLVPCDTSKWKDVCLKELTSSLTLNDGDWVLSSDMVSDGEVKLIQLGSIGNCEYLDKGFKYITKQHFKELNGTQIYPGYLLINRLIANRMFVCILPNISGVLATAVDVCWVAPQENKYDITYLMYALNSKDFQERVKKLGKGTTRLRISKGNLINIKFLLPPLAEQKRIVAKLEELLPLCEELK